MATYHWGAEGEALRGHVVLCHGTPWSAEVWAPVAQELSAQYRVHLWDLPGYGRSAQGPVVDLGLDAQAGRLARLLDLWELERPHLLAHDIGGAVGLGAHLLHGSEFASLMLWDVVTLEPWGSPFFRLVAEHSEVFAALPGALHGALVREYISGAAHRSLGPGQLELLQTPWITGEGQSSFYRQIAALSPRHTRPLVDALGALRCPVAIGWGERDLWIPVEQAARLRRLLPGDPPCEVLPDLGHLAPFEAPDAVGAVVQEWLRGAGRPGGR